jgi:uncharacterized membrane protein YvbJ
MNCGGCGMAMAPGINTCGGCGWMIGRRRNQESLVDDVAQYKASEAALDNLEATGQGDSAAADMARAGMSAMKMKVVFTAVALAIVLIVFLIILSQMHSAANNGAILGAMPSHVARGAALYLGGTPPGHVVSIASP